MRSAKWIAAGSMVVINLTLPALAQMANGPSGYKVEETRLGQFVWVSGSGAGRISVSADGHHIAYFTEGKGCPDGSKSCVILDGKVIAGLQSRYDSTRSLILSFDGKRIAYWDAEGKNSRLVVDGHPGPECEVCGGGDILFSPDGNRLAYVTGTGDRKHAKYFVSVDGKAGPEYDEVRNVSFSPDSNRVAYAARTGKQWSALVDGISGQGYDDICGPTFSPNSKRVAYGARKNKKWSVVVDGQPGTVYDKLLDFFEAGSENVLADQWAKIDDHSEGPYAQFTTQGSGTFGYQHATRLVFSPDGMHLAYAAKRSGKSIGGWVMVVDGREGEEFEDIGVGSPAFSSDGKHMAFSEKNRIMQAWSVVADGQASPEFGPVFNPSFSPDGRHLAYATEVGRGDRVWTLVVDGKAGPTYYAIGNWAFSLDEKHVAYVAGVHGNDSGFRDISHPINPYNGGKWSVVLDGSPGAEYSVILPGTLFFNPDGSLEFFAAQQENHSSAALGSLYHVKYTPTP